MRQAKRFCRHIALIPVMILALLAGWIATRADDNVLYVKRLGQTDLLALDWSGPGPAWNVYAAVSPQSVADPSNEVGETYDPWYGMTMSIDAIEYFLVESECKSGFPEECDGFDNDCDALVDEDFYDPTGEYILRDAHCGACGNSCEAWNACLLLPDCTGTPVPTCTNYHDPCIGPECDEACDNVDNDQDCDVDEDFKDPTGQYYVHDDACGGCGLPCYSASDPTVGCQLVADCLGGLYPGCVGDNTCIGTACPESCDRLDNDLDCDIDEDFKNAAGLYDQDEHCGSCGNNCNLVEFAGRPGICAWTSWWDEAGIHAVPICSVDCTGSCFDVDGDPATGCECCDPLPFEGCGDPAQADSDCDGPDPYDDDCDDWPLPLPYTEYCCTYAGPPLTTMVGCDGLPGAQGDAITLFELDIDGDQVYDLSAAHPVFAMNTFSGSAVFRIHCRVTDTQSRVMYYHKEIATNTSLPSACNKQCYSP